MGRNNSNIGIAEKMPYNTTQGVSMGNRANSNEHQFQGSPQNDYSVGSNQAEKTKQLKSFTERSKSDASTNKIQIKRSDLKQYQNRLIELPVNNPLGSTALKAAVNLSALSNADLQNLISKLTKPSQLPTSKRQEQINLINRKIQYNIENKINSIWIEKRTNHDERDVK